MVMMRPFLSFATRHMWFNGIFAHVLVYGLTHAAEFVNPYAVGGMKLHASARGPVPCRRFTPVANGLICDSIMRYVPRRHESLFRVRSGNINRPHTFLMQKATRRGDEHGHRNSV